MRKVARWRVWLASLIAGASPGWSGYAPKSRSFRVVAIPANASWWKRPWYRFVPPRPAPPDAVLLERMRRRSRLLSPPVDELGVAVPMQRIVSSGEEAIIGLTFCVAFSTGFQVGVAIRKKREPPPVAFPRARSEPVEMSLQIGVRFADGRESSGGWMRSSLVDPGEAEPAGPIIGSSGGGGGGRNWDWQYWIWPLPPDGPVTITSHWPAGGVPDGEVHIDGSAIRRAGESSQKLWTD